MLKHFTKLPFSTLPLRQHHSFFRNVPPLPFIHIKASYAGGLDEGDTLKSPFVLCTRAASWQMVPVVASRRDMNWRNSLGNS